MFFKEIQKKAETLPASAATPREQAKLAAQETEA
jgi:hypothetical protein